VAHRRAIANCFAASLIVPLHEKAGSSTYICRWKHSLAIAAVERPRNAANLPQAVGAEPLPKTRQLNTQNLSSTNAIAKRFSLSLRGNWWNASEMSMPKSHECFECGLGRPPRAVDV
jgi:hypothetical protein